MLVMALLPFGAPSPAPALVDRLRASGLASGGIRVVTEGGQATKGAVPPPHISSGASAAR